MNNRNQSQTNRTPTVSSDGRAVRASMHSPGTASQRRDSDSPSGRDASVATSCCNLTYLNVFTVEEYENNGKTQKKWTRIETNDLDIRLLGPARAPPLLIRPPRSSAA